MAVRTAAGVVAVLTSGGNGGSDSPVAAAFATSKHHAADSLAGNAARRLAHSRAQGEVCVPLLAESIVV